MSNNNILIIGTVPPPIGGVTIYVSRLLTHLEKELSLDTSLFDYKKNSPLKAIAYIKQSQLLHINASNPVLIFYFTVISRLLLKKVVITFHGNISGRSAKASFFNRLSIIFSNVPVLLNNDSYRRALKYNSASILSTAFITPSPQEEILPEDIRLQVKTFISQRERRRVFCTNAYNVSFDKQGNETYGISMLINIFNELPGSLLIFSDPSGQYSSYLKEQSILPKDNILVISEPHPFIEILKLSNGFIRSTSTDGDSISVREALYYGKYVVASDCVSRPEGVVLYKTGDAADLSDKIRGAVTGSTGNHSGKENAVATLINIFNRLIKNA